jgi:signal peptidase
MQASSGFWRTFLSVLVTSALIVVIGLAVLLQVVPRAMGGTSLTVLSGSMEPTFSAGDVIAVRSVEPDDIRVGDIITFQPVSNDATLVTHRVVGVGFNSVDGAVLTTQGDANSTPDDPIVAAQVRGLYLFHVPYLGYLLAPLGPYAPVIAAGLGVLLIGYALFTLLRPRSRRAEHTHAASAVLAVIALVAASVAAPAASARADELDVDFVGPTMHVDWRGGVQTTSETSFFGDRVVTPGDRIARQVRVTNDGPTAGALTVRLQDVVLLGAGDLDDRITLSWAMGSEGQTGVFSDIRAGDSVIAQDLVLATGESRLLTLMLSYPFDATDGATAQRDVTVIEFDIEFVIVQTEDDPVSPLPPTGGVIAFGVLAAGLISLSAGIALLIVRRRRDGIPPWSDRAS